MSTTIFHQPDTLEYISKPAYSHILSSLYGDSGFRYCYKIYIDDVEVISNIQKPSPDGTSYFQVNPIMKNYFNNQIDIRMTGVTENETIVKGYDLYGMVNTDSVNSFYTLSGLTKYIANFNLSNYEYSNSVYNNYLPYKVSEFYFLNEPIFTRDSKKYDTATLLLNSPLSGYTLQTTPTLTNIVRNSGFTTDFTSWSKWGNGSDKVYWSNGVYYPATYFTQFNSAGVIQYNLDVKLNQTYTYSIEVELSGVTGYTNSLGFPQSSTSAILQIYIFGTLIVGGYCPNTTYTGTCTYDNPTDPATIGVIIRSFPSTNPDSANTYTIKNISLSYTTPAENYQEFYSYPYYCVRTTNIDGTKKVYKMDLTSYSSMTYISAIDVPTGIDNINSTTFDVTGTTPILHSGISYYEVCVGDITTTSTSAISKIYKYNYVNCTKRYNTYILYYKNRWGAYDSIQMNSKEGIKNVYDKSVIKNIDALEYSEYYQNINTYNVQRSQTITLTTNYLTELENNMINDIYSSKNLYLYSVSLDTVIPVTISNSYDKKIKKNNQLIQYELTFQIQKNDIVI